MRTTFLYCRGYIKCIIGNPCAFWEVRSENLSDFSLKRRNTKNVHYKKNGSCGLLFFIVVDI